MWCVAEIDEQYRQRMNELLTLYERPHNARFPVVCLDEKSVELHSDKRAPIRRSITLIDSEYIRHGTVNVFMMTEPKGGRHYVEVTKRRTKIDFARCLKRLARLYKDAVMIHLVMDNLNTHNESSLHQAFGEQEGRRLWNRFTVHYTPKHGSWLNQAEIAISVMSRCSLGKERHPTLESVRAPLIEFWRKRRAENWKIDWRFTTRKANEWLKAFQSEH